MPLFGSRIVCKYGNYKYIEERDKQFAEREENLGEWVREKSVRKAALRNLQEKIRQASVSVEEEPSEETVESIRKQVTFCEEGMIAEPLGPSWKAEGTKGGNGNRKKTVTMTLSEQRSCSIL